MFTIYKDISISYFESIISSDPIFMAQTQFVVSEGHNIVKVIQHYGCLRLATITIHSNRTDTTFIMLQSTYIVDNYDWRPQHLKDMASVHIYSYQLLRRDEKITANTNLLCHKVKRNFVQPITAHVHQWPQRAAHIFVQPLGLTSSFIINIKIPDLAIKKLTSHNRKFIHNIS